MLLDEPFPTWTPACVCACAPRCAPSYARLKPPQSSSPMTRRRRSACVDQVGGDAYWLWCSRWLRRSSFTTSRPAVPWPSSSATPISCRARRTAPGGGDPELGLQLLSPRCRQRAGGMSWCARRMCNCARPAPDHRTDPGCRSVLFFGHDQLVTGWNWLLGRELDAACVSPIYNFATRPARRRCR